ncbi:MAG: hypothetical protein ACREJC_12755, partial [Tepidisphaeraceae bacterium]
MGWLARSSSRRTAPKNPADPRSSLLNRMRADGRLLSLAIAFAFFTLASAIVLLRQDVVDYRPGQYLPNDLHSRVEFRFNDRERFAAVQEMRRQNEPRVYKANGDVWAELQQRLDALPQRLAGSSLSQIDVPYRSALDPATLAKIQEYASSDKRPAWVDSVKSYVNGIRALNLYILPDEQRREEVSRTIVIPGVGLPIAGENTYSPAMRDQLSGKLSKLAIDNFTLALQPKMSRLTLDLIKPTHVLDELETVQARNLAADRVPVSEAEVVFKPNMILVNKGEIGPKEWQKLKAEHEAFVASLGPKRVLAQLGLIMCVAILTIVLCVYVVRYQSRILRNHARAIAIMSLLAAMLLVAQLAGISSSPLLVFGVAPTILVAMILTIAYDQRFAFGVSAIHAALVTLALDAPLSFLLILISGIATCCFLLDDLRTRSKLIEVGGATALAMMATTVAAGFLGYDPFKYIALSSLYSGA